MFVQEHTSICLYVRVHCSQCHEMVPKKEVSFDYLLSEMYSEYSEYTSDKVKVILTVYSHTQLDDHMLDDCIEAIVKCCFCDFKVSMLI